MVLLHGYGETGDMWAPLAAKLAADHTVIVPDLRGMGLSAHPAGGYDKKTQGRDIAGVLDALKIGQGRARHPRHRQHGRLRLRRAVSRAREQFVLIDAPLPGVGPWDEILRNPALWHFRFGGPDVERLVKGRERIYLDRFWNEFSADPKKFDEASRRALRRALRPARRDACRLRAVQGLRPGRHRQQGVLAKGKLTMPVLAVGGEKSFGPMMATVMRAAATNVTGGDRSRTPATGSWRRIRTPPSSSSTDFLAQ